MLLEVKSSGFLAGAKVLFAGNSRSYGEKRPVAPAGKTPFQARWVFVIHSLNKDSMFNPVELAHDQLFPIRVFQELRRFHIPKGNGRHIEPGIKLVR